MRFEYGECLAHRVESPDITDDRLLTAILPQNAGYGQGKPITPGDVQEAHDLAFTSAMSTSILGSGALTEIIYQHET